MTPLLKKEDDPIEDPPPPHKMTAVYTMQKSQTKGMNLFQSDFVKP